MKKAVLACLIASCSMMPRVIAAWQPINVGGGGWFERVAVDAAGGLYVASDLSGVYVSHDDGESWSILGPQQGVTSTHVAGFGMHPVNPLRFFVGAGEGIYKTVDGGGRDNL